MSLAEKHCVPCREGAPALAADEAKKMLAELDGWTIEGGQRLVREWKLADFRTALALVNRIGEIAEAEDHHPDIELGWGRVAVRLWTHTAGGLTENDFIVAARIDAARR
ncbi:MAG TPA: 4a-hydroxytetrahydrobiopterin dehydratase [Candidatus Limnocylindrales bacterium]|nr:4a-hydroxytetrahydrobiopterin dehydratase [Candidatus Limnocylindrales bacterium]